MKTLLSIVALAGAIALAGTAADRWAGRSLAIAQADSSACLQNCAEVRKWPEAQCREYCRGKAKKKTKTQTEKKMNTKPETQK